MNEAPARRLRHSRGTAELLTARTENRQQLLAGIGGGVQAPVRLAVPAGSHKGEHRKPLRYQGLEPADNPARTGINPWSTEARGADRNITPHGRGMNRRPAR